jgi:hypothetical protein
VNQFLRRLIQSPRALIPQPIPVKSKNTPIFSKNLYKDNIFVSIIQYIYINMLKKKFIFENEDEDPDDWSDYKNIMHLAKNRISPYRVIFETSDGKSFDDIIEVTHDGIIFTFDGLEDYLKFFFPEEYGENSEDGEYDAKYYDAMYEGRWEWYNDFYDRDSEDWKEGYVTDRLRKNHLELIRDITKTISPRLYTKLSKMLEEGAPLESELNIEIRDFLDTIDIGDEITGTYTDANYAAIVDEIPKGIKDTYCDCLRNVGVERYSQKFCFWKYQMDWGSCMMLYARFGTDEDKLLDLLFEAIRKDNIRHLPVYYEMQYEFWDSQKFDETWNNGVERVLEKKLEEIQSDSEKYDEKYFEVLDKVMELGGVNTWITTKDRKYEIRIDNIEPTNSLITYKIKEPYKWQVKVGKTDIDSLISMIYNEKLFNMMEHLDKFSILRNKTFL